MRGWIQNFLLCLSADHAVHRQHTASNHLQTRKGTQRTLLVMLSF